MELGLLIDAGIAAKRNMLNDPNPAQHRINVARWIWCNRSKTTPRGGILWTDWFSNFFGMDYYKYVESLMIEKTKASAGELASN